MKQFLLFAVIALSTSAVAQNNKISFTKGDKLELVTEVKKAMTQDVMGQTIESTVNSTITQTLDVEDVNATGATIEQKIKRILLNAEAMGQQQNFDSDKEGDRSGDIGKSMEKSLKNKYTMVIDGSGKIVSIKVDDDNPNASDKEDQLAQMLTAQMGFNFGVPKAGDKSVFALLPDKKLGKGDNWLDSASMEGVKRKTTYTVKDITDAEVILDFTEEVATATTQQMMGMDATINLKDKSTGTVVIDKKSGLFKQRTSNTTSEGTVEVQGMSIPMSGKTTIITSLKKV